MAVVFPARASTFEPELFHETVHALDVVRPVADQFYGDRAGGIEDPFGHHWHVATHKEDVSPDEMTRRAAALFPKGG